MKSNIFIPEKINVGFQERSDTYTKQLAYVIYYDEKGRLRKEASWNSWRNKEIEPKEFENVPTEGFVLNKKVGGYSSGWNHRQTYVRVYDPRGFEFEIDVVNLLYILENTNSIKGKGLEGEFVYGWDGKELILIPTSSPDYEEIKKYADTLKENFKLKSKELKVGATYLTKNNEEWVYLGKFDKWERDYDNKTYDNSGNQTYPNITKGKTHFFYNKNNTAKWRNGIENTKTLNKFIAVVDEECDENYAEMFDKLERDTDYSPIDDTLDEYLPYTYDEFIFKANKDSWSIDFYSPNGEYTSIKRTNYGNSTENLRLEKKVYYERSGWMNSTYADWRYEHEEVGNIDDVFNKLQPHYKNVYLQNGKLYSEGK